MNSKYLYHEGGFTLLELMIVMSIIGILSIVAIPKFSTAITLANTSKIQADLQTLDTAIALYQAQNGHVPSNANADLSEYIVDIAKLKPPQGDCFLKDGSTVKITAESYTLSSDGQHALCDKYTLNELGRAEKK